MKITRAGGVGLALVVVILAGACSPAPVPPPTRSSRTPVPTWTLPFGLTSNPGDTATPVQIQVTPGLAVVATSTVDAPTAVDAPATATAIPSPSPTARPGIDPTLGAALPDPFTPLELPVPEPMPQLHLDKDVVNILLLGRDTERSSGSYRTDVMIVVSINKDANSVTMLTIPRDLFVYIPGWTMSRINTAAGYGDAIGYAGGGVALLEQTILYNLGIPIHGWARVDFAGFKNLVDIIGGVDVPVSCAMQDWRLKDPTLDDQNPDNWALYTVEPGLEHMDGSLALWYARSRKRSSDFDRSRRQHQVLRAIFDKALSLHMLTKVPELYSQYVQIVDTDLGLGDLLQFVPLAAQMDHARIKSRFIGRDQVFPYTTSQGAAVLLPNRDAITSLLAEAFRPPADNVLAREAPAVEVWNGTPYQDWTVLAADNLAWDGITPVAGQADGASYTTSLLYDFTTSAKGSLRPELQRLFNIADTNVVAQPDAGATYPYRVILGGDYVACVKPQAIIRTMPTPWAAGGPSGLQGDNIVHAAAVIGTPPGIDGDLAEWTYFDYSLQAPSFGADQWEDSGDLSARWNTAWDEEYLYLALNISDRDFVQLARGQDLFKGDGLEVWFDAQLSADAGTRQLSPDDFQLGLSPGDLTSPLGSPEAYLWYPAAEAKPVQAVLIEARRRDGGYTLEAAIPWNLFHVTPKAGQTYGLALALNDDDTPGSAEQQTQVTNRKDQKLADPATWGVLVLEAPPKP